MIGNSHSFLLFGFLTERIAIYVAFLCDTLHVPPEGHTKEPISALDGSLCGPGVPIMVRTLDSVPHPLVH